MRQVTHAFVVGETLSGKTFWANQAHRRWPGLSIFWNTNHVRDVWGEQYRGVEGLPRAVIRSEKLVYMPPEDPAEAREELGAVVQTLMRWAQRARWSGAEPWAQLVVDEVQVVAQEQRGDAGPVQTVATRGLGAYGVRLVCITQYPAAVSPTVRTNCATRVIFKPGIEGERFLRTYGAYPGEIVPWTERRFHFASYAARFGWRFHPPLPAGLN